MGPFAFTYETCRFCGSPLSSPATHRHTAAPAQRHSGGAAGHGTQTHVDGAQTQDHDKQTSVDGTQIRHDGAQIHRDGIQTHIRSLDAKNWYSGDADPNGPSEYVPIKNDGAYYVVLRLLGHKPRSTLWAQKLLRGTEDVNLDSTGASRRAVFLRKYRVLSLREMQCIPKEGNSSNGTNTSVTSTDAVTDAATARRRLLQQQQGNRTNTSSTSGGARDPAMLDDDSTQAMSCTTTAVDVFTSSYAVPIYECPQNTYRFLYGCVTCGLTATSATASIAIEACQACASSRHLTCTGDACQDCPAGSVSNTGSLLISDCKPFGVWVFSFKGPIGEGSTSEALTAHREGLPAHTPFDRDGFVRDIAVLVGSKVIHVVKKGPRTVVDYPESRAHHLDGATIFQLNLTFLVNGTTDATRITNALLGRDSPSNAQAQQTQRKSIFDKFQLLGITSITQSGRVEGVCPFTYIPQRQVEHFFPGFLLVFFPFFSFFFPPLFPPLPNPPPLSLPTSSPSVTNPRNHRPDEPGTTRAQPTQQITHNSTTRRTKKPNRVLPKKLLSTSHIYLSRFFH